MFGSNVAIWSISVKRVIFLLNRTDSMFRLWRHYFYLLKCIATEAIPVDRVCLIDKQCSIISWSVPTFHYTIKLSSLCQAVSILPWYCHWWLRGSPNNLNTVGKESILASILKEGTMSNAIVTRIDMIRSSLHCFLQPPKPRAFMIITIANHYSSSNKVILCCQGYFIGIKATVWIGWWMKLENNL